MSSRQKKTSRSWLRSIADFVGRQKFSRPVVVVLLVSYAIAFLIVILTIHGGTLFQKPYTPELGTVAPDNITVHREIYYGDSEATRIRREARVKLVPPVFVLNEQIARQSAEAFKRFRDIFLSNFERKGEEAQGSEDTLLTKLQYEFPRIIGKMQKEELSLLASISHPPEVFNHVTVLLQQIMYEGLANLQDLKDQNPELFTAGAVEIRRGKVEVEEKPINELITTNRLADFVQERIAPFPLDKVSKSLVYLLVDMFAEENCFFDEAETALARRRAANRVPDVVRKLVEGQVIVRKGDVIDEESLTKIKAVGQSTITVSINSIVGTAILLSLLFALAVFLFSDHLVSGAFPRGRVYFLAGIGLIYLVIAAILSQIPWSSEWLPVSVLIPTGMFVMLISIIISARIAVIGAVLLSLMGLLVFGQDMSAFLFAFLSGTAGCAVVLGAEKRIDLIRAGLILAVCNCVILLMMGFLKNLPVESFVPALGWGIANGFFAGILSLGFLPILEHAMNAPTRFRLMELSDLNAPIFKKMLSLAPGTYNHSTIVANLAESACTQIGANALLARVGAYYHDIGKIDQARYFIENQRDQNMHDDLKPSLSAAVIRSHVKVGIEKAKELGLPKPVIDIIAQHHGRALISYFYQRALDNESGNNVSSGDFSYTGEWPRTKEAAVIMLADSVEAASRTLKNPGIAKLEKFIGAIVMEKFNSGELSKSNLTFNDLEVIKKSFVHIVGGYFHSRIEYPNQKEEAV